MSYPVSEVKSKCIKQDARDQPDSGTDVLPEFVLEPSHKKAQMHYYGVRIVTGRELMAGTSDDDIFVKLVGSKGMTNKVYLNNYFFSSFYHLYDAKKYTDVVIESAADLGDVLVVMLGNDKDIIAPLGKDWLVSFVTVCSLDRPDENEVIFPCYRWIGDGQTISFTANTMTLKAVGDNDILRLQRDYQLAWRRHRYTWKMFSDTGLPSAIDDGVSDLPLDEQFGAVKSIDFTADGLSAFAKVTLKQLGMKVDELNDYRTLATALKMPSTPLYRASRWTSDVEFGRQMLNGVNPVVIEKLTTIPEKFPVSNEMLCGFLTRGSTLEEEMAAGHIYICDMAIMENIGHREGYDNSAPMVLLYVNSHKHLVPIAIQLNQNPGPENPIFLPSDGWYEWLLAKIYYQSEHGQFHQIAHYLSCHAVMEAYGMATMRNLPDSHPVYKLLRPHFRYTMAINARARATLINKGGIIEQAFGFGGDGKVELMKRGSAAYSVHWTNIKRNVKKRGTDNKDQLPGYYYRDDGFKIWDAMEQLVTDILQLHYGSDDDVKEDLELQCWARDIHDNAFPGYFNAKDGHDFPSEIATLAEIIEYSTLIMFTGSAQHSSINFGQYEIYGFVPNAPTGMRMPPPTEKGVTDYQRLIDSLPDKETATKGIAITYALSQYSRDEIYIRHSDPNERFTEKEAKDALEKFQQNLKNISEEINARNKHVDVPYTYMLPERVTNSITI